MHLYVSLKLYVVYLASLYCTFIQAPQEEEGGATAAWRGSKNTNIFHGGGPTVSSSPNHENKN